MTTMYREDVTCALCGHEQEVSRIGSTSAFGSMDLDTRPPSLQRQTISSWVHECRSCGYVAAELDEANSSDARVVASAEYRAELLNSGRPRLANQFVCRSMLDVSADEFVSAGWRRLHAAWSCDDQSQLERAREQRLVAIDLFDRARAMGQQAMRSVAGGDELLIADLARRAGQFERALESCEAGLAVANVPDFIVRLLRYEQSLIAARDTSRHTIADEEEAAANRQVH